MRPSFIQSFCNLSNQSFSACDVLWDAERQRLSACGQLASLAAAHCALLLWCLWQLCLLRSLGWSFHWAVPAGKALASLASGALLASAAGLGAFDDAPLPLVAAWLAAGLVWLAKAAVWTALGCHRRRSALPSLVLVWLMAVSTLATSAWSTWGWGKGHGWLVQRLLVGAVAVQGLSLLCLSAEAYRSLGRRAMSLSDFDRRLLADGAQLDGRDRLGPAEEGCGAVSYLLFLWTNHLLRKGKRKELQTPGDLFTLPRGLQVDRLDARFTSAREAEAESEGPKALLRSLLRSFGAEYFALGLLKLCGDMLSFSGPILLHAIVSFVGDLHQPAWYGYLYALGLFGGSLSAAFFGLHFSFRMSRVSLAIRAALMSAVYRKVLSLRQSSLLSSGFTQGQIVNFMSTDTERVVNFCPSFHDAWGLPLQLAIALTLLYREVGLAFLAGVGFAILLVPVNKAITSKIGELSTEMMLWKDKRVNLMTELLAGIRSVKLSAWEAKYAERIDGLREQELKYLKGRKYLDAACVYLWASAASVVALATFLTYSLLGHQLTPAKVFTTLSLMSILIRPLNAFPWVLNGLVEAWVSLRRLQSFLCLPETDAGSVLMSLPSGHGLLSVRDASLTWRPGQSEPTVQDFSLDVNKGAFVGLVGPIGSGKSSLLAGLLGELELESGDMGGSAELAEDGVAFATQEPWLQAGSVKDNVLFGAPFDQQRFERALWVCALSGEVAGMPRGAETEVGEAGARLSGGQKARLALARAVYQNAPLYLLDDPLSAVDEAVAEHIVRECIQGELLKRGAAVVLATHHRRFLSDTDLVIRLGPGGKVLAQGPPGEVLGEESSALSSRKLKRDETSSGQGQDEPLAEAVLEEDEEKVGEEGAKMGEKELVMQETGRVEWGVYAVYAGFVGACLSAAILAALAAMQGTKNGTDWWLAFWVSREAGNATVSHSASLWEPELLGRCSLSQQSPAQRPVGFYLSVYGGLTAANSVATLFRAFLFAYGGVVAARKTHWALLRSVLEARLSFFDATPVGRLVNRFSSDLYAVDETLPFQANIFLMYMFGVLGTLGMIALGLPWFLLVIGLLGVLYHLLQRYYRESAVDLKRMCAVSLSPVYALFGETLRGAPTIRAARHRERSDATTGSRRWT